MFKQLTPKQRFAVTCGVGVGDFILKDCPLDDSDNEEIKTKLENISERILTLLDSIEFIKQEHNSSYIISDEDIAMLRQSLI